MVFSLIRPAIFALDPERAHRFTIAALKAMPRGRSKGRRGATPGRVSTKARLAEVKRATKRRRKKT